MTQSADALEARALILAPRGRDAAVIQQVIASQPIDAVICPTLNVLVTQMQAGAGLAFVTEESLNGCDLDQLTDWLRQQPAWSDFPLIVLATKQPGRRSQQAIDMLMALGNVILLERPLNAETLLSAARAALRSRLRQYQTRQGLEDQMRISEENAWLYRAEGVALREAAEARQALALALDAAELGTFHCPLPLKDLFWNETCKRHFWLASDALIDVELFFSIIHEDDRGKTRLAIQQSIDGKQPYDIEYRTVSATGEWRWIRAKGRAYYDTAGRPTRFDGVTIDISRQKQLQHEREILLNAEREARALAEHASRAKDEFLATLSHELRTPLSAVLGWTHVLRARADGSAEILKAAETIDRNARAQARLIEDMLDMSRIIAGTLRLERMPVAVAEVFESVIASHEIAARAKSIRIDRAYDSGVGAVNADGHRLQQIVWNLLSNAIKFTPTGGHVTVSLKQGEDGMVVIGVADDGDGISAEFIPVIFDRFRQADGSSTRSHGGLGLGLAIVRHLVELHGGSIDVHSDGLGKGASFTVRMPAVVANTAMSEAPIPELFSVLDTSISSTDLRGIRILLVDDEHDGLEMMARILGDAGAIVAISSSADQAMQVIADHKIDVLISDIGMPRIDGYELLRQLRSRGYELPAIALTAFARNEDRSRALAAGYAVHLSKPVEPQHLIGAILRVASVTS